MNRFRKLGFINYDTGDHLHVNSSLLNVVLNDEDGGGPVPGASKADARGSRTVEPPAMHGEPPDRERAKRPTLSSAVQSRKWKSGRAGNRTVRVS